MSAVEQLPDNIKDYRKKNKENLLDGYIRFLDEGGRSELLDIVKKSFLWEGGIPFATTAFGDVFVWNDGYIMLYKFTEADYQVILSGSGFFFENIKDTEYQKDFFDYDLYLAALARNGTIGEGECFTIEPIPALGGARELSYIHVGDMNAYLNLVISFN